MSKEDRVVLVIDDSAIIRQEVKIAVEEMGFRVVEASDAEGIVEIFMDIKDVYFIEENFDKNQIFVFNLEIRLDRNSGIRIICQSIYKLFDYVSKNINSLDLYFMDKSCLRSLKNKLRNTHTGNSNINIFLNMYHKNNLAKLY